MIAACKNADLKRTVYAFGDSITDGSGSNPDPLRNWGYIHHVIQSVGWNLVNNAVGGTKIGDAAHTSAMSTISPVPRRDRIVWLSGYNDMRFTGNDSGAIDAYGVALNSALTTLSAHGCPILLGNCLKMLAANYNTWSPYNLGSDAAAAAYSAKLSTVASSFPLVTVVDINTLFTPTLVNLQGDGVHFNYIGTLQIGQVFVNSIIANGLK